MRGRRWGGDGGEGVSVVWGCSVMRTVMVTGWSPSTSMRNSSSLASVHVFVSSEPFDDMTRRRQAGGHALSTSLGGRATRHGR